MSSLSIIIPVYYNEENLEDLYEDLKSKAIPKLKDYEIVMVDDGSGDDSWNVMNRIRMKDPELWKTPGSSSDTQGWPWRRVPNLRRVPISSTGKYPARESTE